MKFLLPFLIFVCLIKACKKQDNRLVNTSVLNFDTTSIQINISDNLESIFFINAKDGFSSGIRGGIYKTTDSAKTWTALNSTTNLPIYSLFFTDSLRGFAVGGQVSCSGAGCTSPGGFILKTINGGQSWTNVYTPSEKTQIKSIYFVNSTLGFCVGRNIIMKTTDAGQTWSEYKVNIADRFMQQIRFRNAQEGYVVCGNNIIVITNDGGNTWTISNQPITNGYYSVATTNSNVYASSQNTIIKSINKGNSWVNLSNAPGKINSMHFVNDNVGYAFGAGNWSGGDFGYSYGSIYSTENGGQSWNGSANIVNGAIKDISFPSGKIAYVLSNGSYLGPSIIRLSFK